MGIREVLAELPSGAQAPALEWEDVGRWLRDRYLSNDAETKRRERARRRAELYRDGGSQYLADYIDKVFADKEVKAKRDIWIEKARYNNVIKRIVHELATLYRKPAARTVADSTANLAYQEVQRQTGHHEKARQYQRLALLHKYLWIYPRVVNWNGARMPRLEIVEPHCLYLVTHPLEPTRLICVLIDQQVMSPRMGDMAQDRPAFLAVTDSEYFRVTASGIVMQETVREHGFKRLPGVLLALDAPPGQLFDSMGGEDLVSAHLAVWFENVLLLKESKSATKVPIIAGDVTRLARAQAMDTEVPIEMPDGTTINSVDMSMDLAIFRDTADNILERAAANYGIPPAILHHAGATSGYEIELRHVGIRERRLEQETPFREFERELATVTAEVLSVDLPDSSFSTDGWSINFGDIQMPREPMEELTIFEKARTLGLTNTRDELMDRDPDLTEQDAMDEIAENVRVETKRVVLMRGLQAASGGMDTQQTAADQANPAQPQQGAMQ
jgi:hypothetical protein